MQQRAQRVAITDKARNVLRQLIDYHGAVLLHQCDDYGDAGSPRWFPVRECQVGSADVLLGYLPWHTEFWMCAEQYEVWKHTHLTVDVVSGRGSGFPLEAPDDVRFRIRSRLLTDAEVATLPPPRTGADRMT
ncbi:DUF779 domain-containing protein [Nocardia brasiliensis]|uniref:DUF779 domain-containing protein n=1 Tax=Nocardia brasiliensis TaxID=37326 RepID=UPI0004A6E0DA|nr:DUF779 domain-containing protein [Nocardia brasiliensis]